MAGMLELDKELTCVYGRAATGKTTLAMMAAADFSRKGQRVLYIDTEKGFNIDRFKQISGDDFENVIDNVIVMKIIDFADQCDKINWLKENFNGFGLIIIDTIGNYYRKLVHDDPKNINVEMAKQIARLLRISKEVPVLMLNQVYDKVDSDEVSVVGGKLITEKCDRLVELSKNNSIRKILMKKPKVGETQFKIEDRGIII